MKNEGRWIVVCLLVEVITANTDYGTFSGPPEIVPYSNYMWVCDVVRSFVLNPSSAYLTRKCCVLTKLGVFVLRVY
jgi:hypothetical protein